MGAGPEVIWGTCWRHPLYTASRGRQSHWGGAGGGQSLGGCLHPQRWAQWPGRVWGTLTQPL